MSRDVDRNTQVPSQQKGSPRDRSCGSEGGLGGRKHIKLPPSVVPLSQSRPHLVLADSEASREWAMERRPGARAPGGGGVAEMQEQSREREAAGSLGCRR